MNSPPLFEWIDRIRKGMFRPICPRASSVAPALLFQHGALHAHRRYRSVPSSIHQEFSNGSPLPGDKVSIWMQPGWTGLAIAFSPERQGRDSLSGLAVLPGLLFDSTPSSSAVSPSS